MKLREKKVNVLGKSIPVIAVIAMVLMAGIAGAMLVNYLSNTTTANIEVTSPMEVGISLGKDSWSTTQCWRADQSQMVDSFPEGLDGENGTYITDWDESDWTTTGTLTIPSTLAGVPVTLYTASANLADVKITAHEEIRVTSPGITPGDFGIITSRFDSIYGDLGYGRLHTDIPDGGCWQVDNNTIELWSDTDTSTWDVGETDVAQWNITFKENALGTYTFSYRVTVIPAIE